LRRFLSWAVRDFPDEPIAVGAALRPIDLGPSALCAVESALFWLLALRRGTTLHGLLWRDAADEIAVAGLVTRDTSPEQTAEAAAALAADGHRVIKLKVGEGTIDNDVARARAACEATGGLPLRLDANRAWSPGQARAAMLRLKRESLPIDYVEEPLATGGLLPDAPLPQALDESLLHAPAEKRAAWLDRLPDVVVLKPMLLGFAETWRLAFEARRRGISAVISSSFESGLGLRHSAALAAGAREPAGLGTASWFKDDPCPLPAGATLRLATSPPVPDARHLERIDAFD
jgi:o-succinylbenzoate synthase